MSNTQSSNNSHPADSWILLAIFVLLGISALMVFSTTAVPSQQIYGNSTAMIKRHLIHISAGLLVFFFFTRFNPLLLAKVAVPLIVLGVVFLAAVLIPGLGHTAGGAQRWVMLGPLGVQPGELCKLFVVLFMSWYIGRFHEKMTLFVPGIVVPFMVLGTYSLLLLLEPDFGTTVVMFSVSLAQLLLATQVFYLASLGGVGVCSFALLVWLSPYRMRRLLAFLDPFGDPSSSGYQLIQSLIAVGSGGIFGLGLGAGKQKLYYLPAAHTDFIYAVIAEELGLAGAAAVLLLFVLILFRGLRIAKRLAANPFLCSLALGCTLLIVLPALLNMAVVCGLLPTKGLVLPLVAYGGTAMIVHLAAAGVLLRLSTMECER